MKLIIGSLNILSPYYAIKWLIPAGLSPLAFTQTKRMLRKSLHGSDKYAWKKYSNWEKRYPILAEQINFVDVMCLQEVSVETLDDMTKIASEMHVARLSCHTSKDPVAQYGNAILYSPKKLKLERTFEVKFAANAIQRTACCAVFTIEDCRILIASIHLRGYDADQPEGKFKEATKKTGYNEIKTYIEEIEKKGIDCNYLVVAGDFNEAIEGKAKTMSRLRYLEEKHYMTDQSLEPTEVDADRKIDWIFFKSNFISDKMILTPMNFERKFEPGSDHLLTATSIEWKE